MVCSDSSLLIFYPRCYWSIGLSTRAFQGCRFLSMTSICWRLPWELLETCWVNIWPCGTFSLSNWQMSPFEGAPEEFDQTIFAVHSDRTIGPVEGLALNFVKEQHRYFLKPRKVFGSWCLFHSLFFFWGVGAKREIVWSHFHYCISIIYGRSSSWLNNSSSKKKKKIKSKRNHSRWDSLMCLWFWLKPF